MNLEPRVNEFIEGHKYNTSGFGLVVGGNKDENEYYRFAIIDFLTPYSRKKKLENILLRKRFNKKPEDCFSCVD